MGSSKLSFQPLTELFERLTLDKVLFCCMCGVQHDMSGLHKLHKLPFTGYLTDLGFTHQNCETKRARNIGTRE